MFDALTGHLETKMDGKFAILTQAMQPMAESTDKGLSVVHRDLEKEKKERQCCMEEVDSG